MSGLSYQVEPVDSRRLPDGQAVWVESLLSQYLGLVQALAPEERALYAQTWQHMARHSAPVVVRSFARSGYSTFSLQRAITTLNNYKLLWFDDDLRAILQCPPFSVLHTVHEVKAFGWERSYACSFVDIPLTLLVYGPNMWLECSSQCPHSGEKLRFRVRMNEHFRFEVDAPPNAWCIWLPLPAVPADDPYQDFHWLRPRIHAYFSAADLDTHHPYQGDDAGVVYTLEQALYLGECLASAYRFVTA